MLSLFGLGAGATDTGIRIGGIGVQRRLLDQVRFLVRDVLLIDRAVGVGLRNLGGLAFGLDLGCAERLDVAHRVSDSLDLERVEDEALLGELLRDIGGDLIRELLALAHEFDDRQRRNDSAQRSLKLLRGELFDRLVL